MRIRRGDLGEVLFLSTARVAWAKPRPDVGVLYSLGIHEVDLYPFLIGADYPERVQAETVFLQRPEIDVVASMFFRFAACAGFAFESWMGPGVKDRRLTVVGSKASAGVDYTNLKEMEIFPSVPGDDPDQVENDSPDIVDLDGAEPLRTEVEDFLQAAESNGRSHPIADAESGCRSVEIIESLKRTGLFIPHGGT
jgi:predicted dehydrogenase